MRTAVATHDSRWTDAFSRRFKSGASEAYVGAQDVIVISKAFTAGEDIVLKWVNEQDMAYVVDIVPLVDGRDLFLLRRRHRKQSLPDALREQYAHLHTLANRELLADG